MQPLNDSAEKLKAEIDKAIDQIGLEKLLKEQQELENESKSEEFWKDSSKASQVMQKLSALQKRTAAWVDLKNEIEDVVGLVNLNDSRLQKDLEKQVSKTSEDLAELKSELKFDEPFDSHEAIVSIYAGAGGTDAQDWTQILFKMYTRWAEQHHYKVATISESSGDEAGLKSVTFQIEGEFVYGKLKGEHGVHRLVRLSPFNANNLRETSFAKVEVSPMIDRPDEVEIDDKDLQVDVFRSGGHGGQSVNTTDSAVRITHLPTGINVVIQNERSQLQNKETAMTIIRSRLIQLQLEQHQDNLRAIKGPNQSAEWGSQIRSYVMHPYKQVKDLRTRYETSDIDGVLKGNIDSFIDAYIDANLQA